MVIVFVVVVGLEFSWIQLDFEKPVSELSIITSVVGSGDDHSKSLVDEILISVSCILCRS